jgi:hypothetical protein
VIGSTYSSWEDGGYVFSLDVDLEAGQTVRLIPATYYPDENNFDYTVIVTKQA